MARKRTPREDLERAVAGTSSAEETPSLYEQFTETIAGYERTFKPWTLRVDKILKRYRDENRTQESTSDSARFNILWSNVQTLVPACFSKLPQPDVSRRFRDQDQVGRVAALILERALEFEVQHYTDYRQTMTQSVHDRFLGGRGVCWVRYEPHFKGAEGQDQPDDGVQVSEDTDESPSTEALDYECAPTDYVHWKDFGHDVARTWEEVTKVWRWVYMGKEAVAERFGEELAGKISYDSAPDDLKTSGRTSQEMQRKQAKICELWDKESGRAYWFCKGYKEFLDERDDPLKLQDFFPCPKPLYATITNESLVPVPDFALYQDQAKELDVLADRMDGLAKMLQVKGVYDASADGSLARLFTEGENGLLLPVKNWSAFAEKGGLTGQVDVFDLKPIYEAFRAAVEGMKAIKEDIYEITGISDIIRGQTQASETATAQQIKGQYASLRLRSMQEGVAYYATQILQLKAQVMCAKFTPQTIAMMAAVEQLQPADQAVVYLTAPGPDGQPAPVPGPDGKPQPLGPAMELLLGKARLQDPNADAPNPMRSFRIEVAADTMVQLDEQATQQGRTEFLQAFGVYLDKAAQVATASPATMPLLVEVGKFVISTYKPGKSLEGTFDTLLENLKQQAAQPKQPPPDPAMAKVQAEAAARDKEMQLEHGREQERMQMEMAAMQAKAQSEERIAARKAELDSAREQFKLQGEFDFRKWEAELKARTQIEVAEISAKYTLQGDQARAASEAAAGQAVKDAPQPKMPDIHVHMPSGNKKITLPDGGVATAQDA